MFRPNRSSTKYALDELDRDVGLPAADDQAADGPGGLAVPEPRTPIGKLLVSQGLLSSEQLGQALTAQTATGERLGEVLVSLGQISDRVLAKVLAEQLGLEVVELARPRLDPELVAALPLEDARRLCAVPLRRVGGRVDVAVGDPLRERLQPDLIERLHAPVRLLVAARSEVERAIERSYVDQAEISGAVKAFAQRVEARQQTQEEVLAVVDENAPIVKVLNAIFEDAVRDRASDIHVEPQADRVRIRVRTDGALHEVLSLPANMATPLISRIKVMAEMNIVERRRPQDGQIELNIDGHDLDVRVATAATVLGETCVMRLLDRTRALLDLSQLGMSTESYEVYERLIRSPYGLVICAGPTGSGKTTTLYATLGAIEDDRIKVTTIEDPVEYVFPTINQIQINEPAGVTFANGLRSILRQDPDAILVGEIRDVETARIAVQAALTGHFVMSSLHATDAASALHRFMDMGIERFLLASSLLGVAGQRLVRKICSNCTEEYTPPRDELSFYEDGGAPSKTTFVHGAGCDLCDHTGYFDRVGAYEVLPITEAVKELILGSGSLTDLRRVAVEDGMRTLHDQALELVARDVTTINEVLRTVYVL